MRQKRNTTSINFFTERLNQFWFCQRIPHKNHFDIIEKRRFNEALHDGRRWRRLRDGVAPETQPGGRALFLAWVRAQHHGTPLVDSSAREPALRS